MEEKQREKKTEKTRNKKREKAEDMCLMWQIENYEKKEKEHEKEMIEKIIVKVISTTIDRSVELFNMKKLEVELERIERVEKGKEMRKELLNRVKLEKERTEAREKKLQAVALRETRRVVWIVVETAIRKSEKGERMIREEIYREEMRMREKDRRNMREATISLVRKRKLGGKPKYKIKET